MKKLFLLLILTLGINTASAQIGKGNVMVGGDIANLNVDFDNQTSMDLTPKAAWFIKDGLAVGAYAKFGFTHINGQDGTNYTYGVGPWARYYFAINSDAAVFKKFKLFGDANVGFEGTDSPNSHTNGLGFGVGPGVTYFITPNVGLEASLKYNGIVGFGSTTYTNGLSLGIGVQVFLPSKKIKEIKNSL